MRVISVNVNGIRSAARKGFYRWLAAQRADFVCMQEIKAHESDLDQAIVAPKNFTAVFSLAEKKGYSGVGLYSRRTPDSVQRGFGSREFDREGRYVEARFGTLSVVSVYFPSGASSPERQLAKFRFLEEFNPHLRMLVDTGRQVVLCGDWNISHKEIDLRNWRSNQKNSGFLPEERAWISQVFDEVGLVDVFRRLNANPDQYTWWSNRGDAWNKNVGWRLDYHVATAGLAETAKKESIYKTKRFSDHAPLTIDYDWAL
ncbi:MAG: exodeoxyribonuclease III [Betaproteobacteria bacterium]|nr:exodeoxyribonuclease III [Betaproteobacteria bacterium]